jgi:hypothetical protein
MRLAWESVQTLLIGQQRGNIHAGTCNAVSDCPRGGKETREMTPDRGDERRLLVGRMSAEEAWH